MYFVNDLFFQNPSILLLDEATRYNYTNFYQMHAYLAIAIKLSGYALSGLM